MTPLEFLSFRDRLESGSGFHSHQFRALEFAVGQKQQSALARYPEGEPEWTWLKERYARPTLWDSFLHFLKRSGYDVPESELNRDVTQPVELAPALHPLLLHIYRNDPAAREISERLVDLDEGMQEWRYRHVKMVERTIGAKMGTGGSAGAEYLRRTLFRAAFPDLWAIRTEL
jgi:tryptophan 2,3-dioxygenase